MARVVVTDISQLQARQDAMDTATMNAADLVSRAHPDEGNLRERVVKIHSATFTGEECLCCGADLMRVEDLVTGHPVEMCKASMDAVIRLSLTHERLVTHLCLECKVTTSQGVANGANHRHELPIEDFMFKGVRKGGLKSLIARGWVEVDEDKGFVLLHQVDHTDTQHCKGCTRSRHPGCPGFGSCGDCVATPETVV